MTDIDLTGPRMTASEFQAALRGLGFTLRGFAAYTGSNERSVRRWADGEQDVPRWTPVLLGLLTRLVALGGERDWG